MIIGFLLGLTNGFAIIIAQKFGEKDENEIKKAAAGTIFLCFLTAVSITAISLFFLDEILNILNVSDILYVESKGYIKAILLGMTATMFYNAFAGILRAVGDTAAVSYTHLSEEKDRIGKKAASYVKNGETIFLDSGSTTECVIKYLSGKEDVKVVTNGFTHKEDLTKRGI